MLIFWIFAFPIILGTFFYFAFSNIEQSEKLDTISIAIVENEEYQKNPLYKEVFEELSDPKQETPIFSIQYVSSSVANEKLKQGEITGYFLLEDVPKVVVRENGINETVFQFVTEEIYQTSKIMNSVIQEQIPESFSDRASFYETLYQKIEQLLQDDESCLEDVSSSKLSYTMIEFYTLIAMAALYGGILGMEAIHHCLANMSAKGKRVSVSSAKKKMLIFSSVCASYLIQLIGIALLFLYTIFVLHVDYGTHFFQVVLLSLAGCLAGLSVGVFVASCFKTSENAKTGIILSFTMFGCFLSGMMGITMKYIVDKNLPILNLFNPANMITDGFYSLYYYDTSFRFYRDFVSLLVFSFLFIGISIFCLRRQRYDSL